MEQLQNADQMGEQIKGVPAAAIQVITNPGGFYRQMPKTGGFVAPLLFMVVMGVVAGLLGALLSLLGLGSGGVISGMAAVILMPIMVAVFGFISAAILFVVWKMIGSQESYETAYRCMAYTAAIIPITTLLDLIPYLGSILGLVWMTYLLVVASTEVHGIQTKKAWVAFGAICALLAVSSVSMEIAGRKLSSSMEEWQQENQAQLDQLDNMDEMSPEEAGEAVGQFLKAFGQSTQE